MIVDSAGSCVVHRVAVKIATGSTGRHVFCFLIAPSGRSLGYEAESIGYGFSSRVLTFLVLVQITRNLCGVGSFQDEVVALGIFEAAGPPRFGVTFGGEGWIGHDGEVTTVLRCTGFFIEAVFFSVKGEGC